MRSSMEDSPMTVVSSRLTSARNSKKNIRSGGASSAHSRAIPDNDSLGRVCPNITPTPSIGLSVFRNCLKAFLFRRSFAWLSPQLLQRLCRDSCHFRTFLIIVLFYLLTNDNNSRQSLRSSCLVSSIPLPFCRCRFVRPIIMQSH